jgi:predicted RNA-binding Zn-ribbon protein involved in translation (DUF1610 family)
MSKMHDSAIEIANVLTKVLEEPSDITCPKCGKETTRKRIAMSPMGGRLNCSCGWSGRWWDEIAKKYIPAEKLPPELR